MLLHGTWADDRNKTSVSTVAYWHDPKSGAGQCLNDTFRNLFGLLRVYATLWMILARVVDRSRDYRVHLMLIGHTALPIPAVARLAQEQKVCGVLSLICSTMRLFPE